ncbi:MAG: DUF3482 domain-containing protein [Acidobacteriota bacterium]
MSGSEPQAEVRRINLSLVSHTNVGKTTLARTLLRRDVGEVLDQAHVTEVAVGYTLIDTPTAELKLWDTPGFGDSVRLLKRLVQHNNPILWLVRQTWDRFADRPLWCSQQAALNIRDESDLVLYLVNASEEPEDAGYLVPELEVLSWIGRPIVLLLNQTGGGDASSAARSLSVERWRQFAERWPVVRDVLALDAFSRCWVQESVLLERIVDLLPAELQPLMSELEEAWNHRNLAVFERSVEAMARTLHAAAIDREELPERRPSRADKQRGMEVLAGRLERASSELMATLLEVHGLEGTAVTEIDRQLDAFAIADEDLIDPEKGAVWGSVVSGALGGLSADLLSGGLSFGGGMLAGAILGALGGAGLARGFQLIKGERLPAVTWTPPFLEGLVHQALLRYLAVAHFGRGRGEFQEREASQRWRDRVQAALHQHSKTGRQILEQMKEEPVTGRSVEDLRQLLDTTLREILVEAYPRSRRLLGLEKPAELPGEASNSDTR